MTILHVLIFDQISDIGLHIICALFLQQRVKFSIVVLRDLFLIHMYIDLLGDDNI